ncbi:hypothetical protein AAFF_G00379110 [Aldrovandia affinis]|uniref:Uncharacterized protein n=1 Tax=Aldrovandia affinis TaxID=143900 RepID=A0AAD7WML4_9TELE|nr:hypothetical protein AAFF_G00379110 [Aldrovandia affinis]
MLVKAHCYPNCFLLPKNLPPLPHSHLAASCQRVRLIPTHTGTMPERSRKDLGTALRDPGSRRDSLDTLLRPRDDPDTWAALPGRPYLPVPHSNRPACTAQRDTIIKSVEKRVTNQKGGKQTSWGPHGLSHVHSNRKQLFQL